MRRFFFVATVVMLLGAGGAFVAATNTRRAEEAATARGDAEGALQRAREGRAGEWFPEELAGAESLLREGYLAERLALARTAVLPRDFAHAVSLYEDAARAGQELARASLLAHQEALATARRMIDGVSDTVARIGSLAESVHVGPRRQVLQRARLALDEARRHFDAGDFELAAERARAADRLAADVGAHTAAITSRYRDDRLRQLWRTWRDETVAWSKRRGRVAIVVDKENHLLTLYDNGRETASYPAEMGFNWIADKLHAGDGATPEGRYEIISRKGAGASQFYKALLLNYPNDEDRKNYAEARRRGLVSEATGIGGLIEIHGDGGKGRDWTKGCVALANQDMDRLFGRAPVGTPVTIVGSVGEGRLTTLPHVAPAPATDRRTGAW